MSKHLLIGFTGPAGCGKTSAAGLISQAAPKIWQTLHFADPIREMIIVGLGLGINENPFGAANKENPIAPYGVSPRKMMQTLGTGWGRDMIDVDMWVKILANRRDGRPALVPDVREDNEADYIRANGVLVHIGGRARDGVRPHSSEDGLEFKIGDIMVDNSGSRVMFNVNLKRALDL